MREMRRQTPALEQSVSETGQVRESVTHPGVLSLRVTPVSGTQVTSPEASKHQGGPAGLSASLGFFDRLCFWQRISGTGNEGAVLK